MIRNGIGVAINMANGHVSLTKFWNTLELSQALDHLQLEGGSGIEKSAQLIVEFDIRPEQLDTT